MRIWSIKRIGGWWYVYGYGRPFATLSEIMHWWRDKRWETKA